VLYVLDTNSFLVLKNYYPERFPSFWEHLTALAASGRLQSVSEVWKELDRDKTRPFLVKWLEDHKSLFPTPTAAETAYVAGIFAVPAFQALVKFKNRLEGSPVADPWVIARAAQLQATVVTEESADPKVTRIPAVCAHFKVPCLNFEGVMAQEGWKY